MKREGAGGYFFIFKVVLLNESIFFASRDDPDNYSNGASLWGIEIL